MIDLSLHIDQWMDPAKCIPSTWFRWFVTISSITVLGYYLIFARQLLVNLYNRINEILGGDFPNTLAQVFILCGICHIIHGSSLQWQYSKLLLLIAYPILIYKMHRLVKISSEVIKKFLELKTNKEIEEIVTQRGKVKEAADRIRQFGSSMKRYKHIWLNQPNPSAIVAKDGIIKEVNDSLCQEIGLNRNKIVGGHFAYITHPEDLEADLTLFKKLIEGEIEDYRIIKRYKDFNNNDYFQATLTVWDIGDNHLLGSFYL